MLNRLLRKIPVVSDYYAYYNLFPKTITACRGVYSSFSKALQAVPQKKLAGYNQPIISQHHNQSQSVTQLTNLSGIESFHLIDYPVVLWLKSAFTDSSTVCDLGGNVGIAYYTYRKFLSYPDDLQWLVCEIPEIVKVGKDIASQKGIKNLSFTTEVSEPSASEIFLTCGTLQYLESTLPDLLKPFQVKPKHLLINHVPFYDGETFTTLQNVGYAYCPYKVQNRSEFLNALILTGYELVDSWEIPRSFSIPFHPERFVPNYHGFYLHLRNF